MLTRKKYSEAKNSMKTQEDKQDTKQTWFQSFIAQRVKGQSRRLQETSQTHKVMTLKGYSLRGKLEIKLSLKKNCYSRTLHIGAIGEGIRGEAFFWNSSIYRSKREAKQIPSWRIHTQCRTQFPLIHFSEV